ncbi:tetratricopeptide repeat protein [Roseibium aestuarii]|uniref:Tetratricopeptide repeat protein n=1 Tax=Roseibium aestuarii TaxID=2600299 RepID=A0ABW4K2A7_9HYPH|nr:tetratricopeptide repeat protein [Roseibium aestuarii]
MLKHFWTLLRKGETFSTSGRAAFRWAIPVLCRLALAGGSALAVTPLALSVASAQALQEVTLAAGPEEGYGRVVLTFKDRTLLPIYDAAVTGGVLRISFEEPISVDVEDVPLVLGDYVTIARRDPDGSAIRFALKSNFRINTLEAGEKLFIDILPATWQGLPPGLPDDVVRDLAKRAEEAMRKVRALEQARLQAKEGPRVDLHIGTHPTFTRLVFDWSIAFDTAFVREDDLVRVSFNHPAQLDISELRAHLPPGVVDATSFLDGGKLKFLMRLDEGTDIRAFREEQTYVIDITAKNAPAPDAVNQAIQNEMGVQQEEGRTGLVVAPGARNESGPPPAPTGDAAAPLMEGNSPLQNSALPAPTPAAAAAAARDGAPVDQLASGEVTPSTFDQTPQAKPAAEDAALSAGEPRDRAQPGDALDAASAPIDPDAAANGALQLSAIAPTEGAPVLQPPAAGASDPTTAIDPAAVSDIPPVSVAQTAAPAQPVAEAPVQAAQATVAPTDAPVPSGVPQALPVGTPAAPPVVQTDRSEPWRAQAPMQQVTERVSPEQPPADAAADVRNFVNAEARRIGNTVRVVFPFVEPVSSAIFRRNDSIWMVFDTDATIDTRGMESALSGTADTIAVSEGDGYQILRLDLNDPVLATVGLDGNAWSLVIGDMILEPSIPLKLERNVRSDGGSVLRILYQNPQHIRELEDPFVGDKIGLVTGFGPPRGLLKAQKFVDIEALSSAQGVAIIKKSDDVTMKLLGDDVIIEKGEGLSLSNNHLRGGTGAFNGAVDPNEPGYVEFVSLSTEGPMTFLDRLHKLQNDLAQAPEGRRRKEIMDLSRFYLAHQFAQEALGLMQLALEEDPVLAEDASFNLMYGAALTLASREKEAYDYLNRPELKNSPDAAVWQTIVDSALQNWTAARIAIPRGRAVIGNYPKSIQTEFNLAAALTMVEANDFGVANGILAEVEPADVTSSQAARYDILRGRVADASGRSQEALNAFDYVAKSDDRPRAAEAEYRALRIRYRDGEASVDETIDRLAGLATSWRGDEIELKTLRFLAQLYAEQGRYREAFEAMKSAVQANPDADTTRLLQEEMNALFASLYLDGKADEMPAVKALALFYDFREMTPIGRQGDEMVRGLAKRLVEVDLLDQAAGLLRHQVDNRLKGSARSQIAADLAAIYLADRKPEEALRVLNKTRQSSLPNTLERQRNVVEARALTASGRPDLALELVRNMRGTDVDRLRADTFWAAQSWREAGEQLEAMHSSRWSDTIALDDLERRDILKAAIAYSLAGDQLSLDRLKSKYLPKMTDSPEALAFEVVTRPVEAQGVEFLEVANKLADTDELETFLQEYRRQYMTPSTGPGGPAPAPQAAAGGAQGGGNG